MCSKLVQMGLDEFNSSVQNSVHFVDDQNANDLLNDLKNYPHAFVLACCMDRQCKAEAAWEIPFKIKDHIGSFGFSDLKNKSRDDWETIFKTLSLHRFNQKMSTVFYEAIQTIANDYNGIASKIWGDKPSSATVVYRFLQFNGVGVKIATMAANILARSFKIPFSDYHSIDVSPDVHIKRVMERMGLVRENATREEIIYKARELYPEFPGIIDSSLWEVGRTWCKAKNPDCTNCIISTECKKIIH